MSRQTKPMPVDLDENGTTTVPDAVRKAYNSSQGDVLYVTAYKDGESLTGMAEIVSRNRITIPGKVRRELEIECPTKGIKVRFDPV